MVLLALNIFCTVIFHFGKLREAHSFPTDFSVFRKRYGEQVDTDALQTILPSATTRNANLVLGRSHTGLVTKG